MRKQIRQCTKEAAKCDTMTDFVKHSKLKRQLIQLEKKEQTLGEVALSRILCFCMGACLISCLLAVVGNSL